MVPFQYPDRPPVPVTHVRVGVAYAPLRRLWPLLDRFDLEVLDEDVWPEEERLELATAEDAERAARRLAALIGERAVAFAERHASLEALTAQAAPLTRAALLAAAGRFGAARDALAGAGAAERSRLTRAERAALDEVKATAEGVPRHEARAMLRDALARQGAPEQSPLWIESRLEHLWDSPQEQVRRGVSLLRGAARLGLGVMQAIRDRELPDLSPPEWLEPPDHALYEIPRTGRWAATELDSGATAWLDRVYEATPHPFGFATLTAWVRGRDVYLGQERVGQVAAGDAAAYADVLADARARDEDLCLEAHLARRGGARLLEVARP
jgi:hypothetical protein